MKRITLHLTAVLVSTAFLLGCNPSDDFGPQDQNPITDDEFRENFGSEIVRDFIGQIVDVDGNPVQGAAVTIGNKNAMTDLNGVFIINSAGVYQRFAYIKASKPGYVDGSRAMVPVAGKNNVVIMLLPSQPLATISSGVQSEVALPSGTKIVFDGAFQTEAGAAYDGEVAVSLYHLQQSNENVFEIMPGMLYGQDSTGDEAVLMTYGMVNVELRGSNGQKLQIASGHKATVEMIIDSPQMGVAPTTIPLWHFDEVNGYWKQEGEAIRQGNKYVGEVSHFSWWNCDVYESTVNLTLNFVNEFGQPLPTVLTQLRTTDFYSSHRYTSPDGIISGVVPASQELMLYVSYCGETVLVQNLGTFSSDSSLTITLSIPNTSLIQGTFLNCEGSPVAEGYVMARYDEHSRILPVTDGSFVFAAYTCDSESPFYLQGFDLGTSQMTELTVHNFTYPTTNVGSISSCESAEILLVGDFNLVVTNTTTGFVRTFPNEMITQVSPFHLKTSSTGTFIPGALTPAPFEGFNFYVSQGIIIVPEQNLANYWANLVLPVDDDGIDGLVFSNDSFTIDYRITFAAGDQTYHAVYTRN